MRVGDEAMWGGGSKLVQSLRADCRRMWRETSLKKRPRDRATLRECRSGRGADEKAMRRRGGGVKGGTGEGSRRMGRVAMWARLMTVVAKAKSTRAEMTWEVRLRWCNMDRVVTGRGGVRWGEMQKDGNIV